MGSSFNKNSKVEEHPECVFKDMVKPIYDIPFTQDYQITGLIGKGSYAQVYKGFSKRSKNVRAIKRIDRAKHAKIQPILLNQFENLKQLDHPNILKIYNIYGDSKYYHIITQLCSGKELFDVLSEKKMFQEVEACTIFIQILSAIQHMHRHKIMHRYVDFYYRDVKPENLMYNPETKILKVIDFGSAVTFETNSMTHYRKVGTSYYIAPEVLNQKYNFKCDIWSAGVTLYVLLSGQLPFRGKTDKQILQNVATGSYSFKSKHWDNISSEAKMLITEMLQMDPMKRPSVEHIMGSDWVQINIKKQQLNRKSNDMMGDVLNNMQRYERIKLTSIQGGIIMFMVNFIDNSNDEAEIFRCFRDIDLNGDGYISKEELKIALIEYVDISEQKANDLTQAIFKKMDVDRSGFIDYSEFLIGATNLQTTITEQNLKLAFDSIDQDGNGSLSLQEIRGRIGDSIPEEKLMKQMKDFKLNKNGQISRSDFVMSMRKLMQNY